MAVDDVYCFDTSALFDAGIRWYPPDIFPSFWGGVDDLISRGRLLVPEMVAREATQKTHSVAIWVKEKRSSDPEVFVDLDDEIQDELRLVTATYPEWTAKGRNRADPFVVATAKAKGLVVVTGETPSTSSPLAVPTSQRKLKIPTVCDHFGVNWMVIPDLIKQEGWTF